VAAGHPWRRRTGRWREEEGEENPTLLIPCFGNESLCIPPTHPRKGGYIELAIHGPLWAVHRPYGPLTHIQNVFHGM
jgi:hypothetical protein